MDRRSWPWKKKASDKSILVIDSAADASHSQIDKVFFYSLTFTCIVTRFDEHFIWLFWETGSY